MSTTPRVSAFAQRPGATRPTQTCPGNTATFHFASEITQLPGQTVRYSRTMCLLDTCIRLSVSLSLPLLLHLPLPLSCVSQFVSLLLCLRLSLFISDARYLYLYLYIYHYILLSISLFLPWPSRQTTTSGLVTSFVYKKGGSSIVPVLWCLETKEMQQVDVRCSGSRFPSSVQCPPWRVTHLCL